MSSDYSDPLVSLPTSISPENLRAREAFCQLTALAPPPHGAPCSRYAARGFRICLDSALSSIPSPNGPVLTIRDSYKLLESELTANLTNNATAESFTAINGTKTRHSEWHLIASIGANTQVHLLATTYVGLKSLMAIRMGKPLSGSAIENATALLKENDLSIEQIKALFHGTSPEQTLGQSWPRDLCRTWRDVMRHYSSDGSPPPPTNKERIAGQMLDAALHATTSRRAGARSHRQLSKSQLHQALVHLRLKQEKDTLLGALGVLVCISTFSVDLTAELPLKSSSLDTSWLAQIDVEAGLLTVDYNFLAQEAAAPIMGAIPATYICTRPMPQKLANDLRARARKYPHAKTLKELFPDDAVPAHDSLVFVCKDQIRPTWARLRRSVGTYLRESGLDNFLASVVSGDFTHVPRSKLYYACATIAEIATAFDRFYKLAGWSEPELLPAHTLAFGCQVVPTMESLMALDQHWQVKMRDSHPGKHCSPDNLMNFHNHFMCWTAMRLSLLLALRESTEITLSAAINEQHDRWIPIHDKHVPGYHGATPVALTQWVKLTIGNVRTHCKAMLSRLKKMGLKDSDLARWCDAVCKCQNVPLLCITTELTGIRPVGTADFLNSSDIVKLVPPDFGRKAMENLLRTHGLRATEIDAILRHSMQGQSTNSSTSDTVPTARWQRADHAVTQIALSIFKDVGVGLAKE